MTVGGETCTEIVKGVKTDVHPISHRSDRHKYFIIHWFNGNIININSVQSTILFPFTNTITKTTSTTTTTSIIL